MLLEQDSGARLWPEAFPLPPSLLTLPPPIPMHLCSGPHQARGRWQWRWGTHMASCWQVSGVDVFDEFGTAVREAGSMWFTTVVSD